MQNDWRVFANKASMFFALWCPLVGDAVKTTERGWTIESTKWAANARSECLLSFELHASHAKLINAASERRELALKV